MKKTIIIIASVLVGVGALVAVLLFSPMQTTNQNTTETDTTMDVPTVTSPDEMPAEPAAAPSSDTPAPSAPTAPAQSVAAGRYTDYSASAVAQAGYTETIIFFHAAWCPECRAFEQAITGDDIPAGVQILKADYDTSDELRQRYGVTIQSTFVKVDANGSQVSKWVGYGRDKSLNAVLENT